MSSPKPFDLKAAKSLTIPREREEKSIRQKHPDSLGYSKDLDDWVTFREQADLFRATYNHPPCPYAESDNHHD